ncbi:MAG: hypothetical protein DMF63_14590 [Acidobacteria bacterium]|nr:MAG: hypothetical protein DMF63_14590 [Acidobacteriota bacterium]
MLSEDRHMKIGRSLTVLLMFVLIASLCAVAQDKDRKKKSDEPKVQTPVEVKANVMVLDPKNELVNEIKIEDLKVFEDDVEQKLTSFEKKDPLSLALLVDNSGSLRSQIGTIINVAKLAVFNLDADDEGMVIRFISSDKIEVLQEWTPNKAKMIGSIENLYVEGGQSAVSDALFLAVERIKEMEKSDRSKKYAVLLVSDCEDINSYYSFKDLLKSIGNSGVQIFPFAMMSEIKATSSKSARTFASTVSLRTGGNVYFHEKKYTQDQVLANLKAFFIEMRSQYVISYTSTNTARDSTRKLRVEVKDGANGEKRQGLVRDSYYVPEKY